MKIFYADTRVEEYPGATLTIEDARQIIGGWVETLQLRNKHLALFDEEGLPKKLRYNHFASLEVDRLSKYKGHKLVGTVIIIENENFE